VCVCVCVRPFKLLCDYKKPIRYCDHDKYDDDNDNDDSAGIMVSSKCLPTNT